MNDLGDFQLGETTTVLGGDSAAGGQPDTLSGSGSGSTASTSTSAGAQPTTATATTEPSSGDSSATDGNVTALTGDSLTATTFTATSAGEVLSALFSTVEAIGFETKVSAFGAVSALNGTGVTSDPFTSVTAKDDLQVGDFQLGGASLGVERRLTTTLSGDTIQPLNYAIDLDGTSSQYIEVSSPDLNFSDGDNFFVGAFFKLRPGESGVLMSNQADDGASTEGWEVYIDQDGNIQEETTTSSSTVTTDLTNDYLDNGIHHVLFVYDEEDFADLQKVYVDGTEISGGGVDAGDIFDGSIYFGARGDGSDPLRTQVQYITVHEGLPSSSQIDALTEKGGVEDGLLARIPIDTGSGSTLYDRSGNDNDGVLQGGTWTTTGAFTSSTAETPPASLTGEPGTSQTDTQTTGGSTPQTLSGDLVVATASTSATSEADSETLEGAGTVAIGFQTLAQAFGSPVSMNVSGTVSDPFTEATAKRELEVGNFTLGEQTLGEEEFLTASMSLTTDGEGLSEGFGGDVTTMESETFEADSFSEGISGDTTSLNMADILADSFSEANADAGINTLTFTPLQAIRYLPDWAVYPGPKVIETVNEEVRTFREMTLTWILSREELVNVLRPEIDDAGSLEIVDRIDGGFDVVTRGEANDIRLAAPTDHADVRPIEDWFVQEFEEEPLGTDAERWKAEVVVSPDKEKAYDNEYGTLSSAPSKTRSSGEWLFEFAFGDVATRRVTSDVTKAPDGSVDTAELDLVLEPEEVRVIEESLSKLAATNFVGVPDGSGYIEDTSDSNRNTVTLTVPSAASDTVASADYVVTEWETTWTRNRAHTVSLVLKQP